VVGKADIALGSTRVISGGSQEIDEHGEDSLLETFYPVLEEKGFEGAFLHTFGITVDEFMALPSSQQHDIIP
tara:strand:- start:264 stop:479 length:216 start_codon:yes stop_codon:yes gene_type:complete